MRPICVIANAVDHNSFSLQFLSCSHLIPPSSWISKRKNFQKKKPASLLQIQIRNELCMEVQCKAGAFRRTNISRYKVQWRRNNISRNLCLERTEDGKGRNSVYGMKNQIKGEKPAFSGICEKWSLMNADYHRCARVISTTNAFVEPEPRKSGKNRLVRRIGEILDSS